MITPFWQNAERNSNSARMVPGITRTELHPEFTGTEFWEFCLFTTVLMMPNSSVDKRRCSIWASSTTLNPTLPQPSSFTIPTKRPHVTTATNGCHHPRSSSITPTNHGMDQQHMNHTRVPRHCLNNKATTPRHPTNERPPGYTSLTAMWQPDDKRRQTHRSSSFLSS